MNPWLPMRIKPARNSKRQAKLPPAPNQATVFCSPNFLPLPQAPRGPHLAECTFQIPRKPLRAHEGGFLEHGTEGGAVVGEDAGVGGEAFGDLDVLVGGVGDEFEEAEAGEDADAA